MGSRTSPRSRVGVVILSLFAAAVLSAIAGQAYSLKSVKWKNPPVSYYVDPSNADISEAAAEAAIREAADAWSLQTNADFSFTYAGRSSGASATYNQKNEVFFSSESNGSTLATTYSWSYSSTGEMVDFDIKFWDGGVAFFTGLSGCSSGAYVEDVGTHEFGHALGLNHSTLGDATMYGTMYWCSSGWRSLSADDIAGAEAQYPPGGSTITPPAAPSNLAAGKSQSSPTSAASLAWADNSTNEDRFLVERSTDGAVFSQVASLAANSQSYADSGLQAATSYTYRVRASNGTSYSDYTNPATVTTEAGPPTPPSVPSASSPANGAANVNVDADLAWTCSGASSYEVYFGPSSTPSSYAKGVTSSALALPRLSSGTTYYWKVVATNVNGSSSSSVWSFTTKAARGKSGK